MIRAVLLGLLACGPKGTRPGAPDSLAVDTVATPAPILLVVLADDLGDNSLWAMDAVTTRLEAQSVRFSRTYVTVPLCCPSRSSLLLGGYTTAETGVYANEGPNGGIAVFPEADTLGTIFQSNGWTTALVGKYLNGYDEEGFAPAVPPGWDLFLAPTEVGDFTDAQIVRGSSTPEAGAVGVLEDTGGAHLTGWLFDEAIAFLDAHPDEPTLLLLTPQSPHLSGTPEAEDQGTWAEYQFRPPSFAEEDVSDKPAWIQAVDVTTDGISAWDAETALMMENLASLDRAMEKLLDALEERGLEERTTLVFTSDNGHLHGEHRLSGKGLPYEESIRVPLLIRQAGLAPRTDERLVAMNLDLPATLLDWAGLPSAGEGESLVATLADPASDGRESVFIETALGKDAVWAGVVTEDWKYVEWGSGETELYDLKGDPYELSSLHADPPTAADVAALASWTEVQRALNITTITIPNATPGVAYEQEISAWGGDPPLSWTLESGALPSGLSLSEDGVLSGTPTADGTTSFTVRVTDSGASPVTGQPQHFSTGLALTVGPVAMPHAKRTGEDVFFRVPGRPGSTVEIRFYSDSTRDMPPTARLAARVGPDGWADLVVEARATQRWWSWTMDGVESGTLSL